MATSAQVMVSARWSRSSERGGMVQHRVEAGAEVQRSRMRCEAAASCCGAGAAVRVGARWSRTRLQTRLGARVVWAGEQVRTDGVASA